MKIAERIKAAIALNPQITANRAKLRAMYYLQKNNPDTMRISISTIGNTTDVSLMEFNKNFGWSQTAWVMMSPLSCTPTTEGLKQLAEKGISGIGGVALDCVKKVLDNMDQKR